MSLERKQEEMDKFKS